MPNGVFVWAEALSEVSALVFLLVTSMCSLLEICLQKCTLLCLWPAFGILFSRFRVYILLGTSQNVYPSVYGAQRYALAARSKFVVVSLPA